jgi:hypothetical protein
VPVWADIGFFVLISTIYSRSVSPELAEWVGASSQTERQKYHLLGCKFLGKSSIPVKLSDAKKYYQVYKLCKPPE